VPARRESADFVTLFNHLMAAVAEGIVPGGGLALLRCVDAVSPEESKCDGDEKTGVQILKRALEAPTSDCRKFRSRWRCRGRADACRQREQGFDAGRKEYVDLFEAGIIDPTKVVRIALENAVSVASVLLLTEATMTEIPGEKNERIPEPEMGL
jgi:chaperonin GroEL